MGACRIVAITIGACMIVIIAMGVCRTVTITIGAYRIVTIYAHVCMQNKEEPPTKAGLINIYRLM